MADADVGDRAAIVDVAAEADLLVVVAAVLVAVLAAVAAARAQHARDSKAVIAALHIGDRGHAKVRMAAVIVVVAAVGVAAVAVASIVAVAVLGSGLGDGGGRALRHRLAIGDVV